MCFAMGAYHDLRRSRTACPLGVKQLLWAALVAPQLCDGTTPFTT